MDDFWVGLVLGGAVVTWALFALNVIWHRGVMYISTTVNGKTVTTAAPASTSMGDLLAKHERNMRGLKP